MIALEAIDHCIEKFADQLEREQDQIAKDIAAKSIGASAGYWKEAHRLSLKIETARRLREAFEEAQL